MPRITPTHWAKLRCVFEKAGFVFDREEGDHIALVKAGIKRPVIIPKYKYVGLDIILANMRTANMSRAEYFKYLSQC